MVLLFFMLTCTAILVLLMVDRRTAQPVLYDLQGGAAVTWEALEPEIQMVAAVDSVDDESQCTVYP